MHFLEAFERAAQYFCHDLGMFSYIAVPVGVGMRGFEDENVASIYVPSFSISKRRKRPFVVQLSPMALAVAVSEMTLPAIWKDASHLWLEQWS
jgi:hypothetical protein